MRNIQTLLSIVNKLKRTKGIEEEGEGMGFGCGVDVPCMHASVHIFSKCLPTTLFFLFLSFLDYDCHVHHFHTFSLLFHNNIMSIIRGVNRRSTSELHPKQSQALPNRTRNASQLPSSAQFDQMLQQMKSLMKQNTRLKHENLQLKQQLMLARIELENTRLQNQENLINLQEKIGEPNIHCKKDKGRNGKNSQRVMKIDSSIDTLLRFEGQDFALGSTLDGKENVFCQWQSKETLASPTTMKINSKFKTPRYDCFNSIELMKASTQKVSIKYTKKDQILDKYRKFLSNCDSDEGLVDK